MLVIPTLSRKSRSFIPSGVTSSGRKLHRPASPPANASRKSEPMMRPWIRVHVSRLVRCILASLSRSLKQRRWVASFSHCKDGYVRVQLDGELGARWLEEEERQQSRTLGKRGDEDVLVRSMSTRADRPQSVERRRQGARQVCVRSAADDWGLVDVETEVCPEPLCPPAERAVASRSLHRRSAEASIDRERDPGPVWLQRTNGLGDPGRRRLRWRAHVHHGRRLGGDDIRAQAAVDRPHVHGYSALRIVEREQLLDQV